MIDLYMIAENFIENTKSTAMKLIPEPYEVSSTIKYRSSRSQMSFKISVLKNFANFTGKNSCWSLQYMCFPVKSAKFLRTPF